MSTGSKLRRMVCRSRGLHVSTAKRPRKLDKEDRVMISKVKKHFSKLADKMGGGS